MSNINSIFEDAPFEKYIDFFRVNVKFHGLKKSGPRSAATYIKQHFNGNKESDAMDFVENYKTHVAGNDEQGEVEYIFLTRMWVIDAAGNRQGENVMWRKSTGQWERRKDDLNVPPRDRNFVPTVTDEPVTDETVTGLVSNL